MVRQNIRARVNTSRADAVSLQVVGMRNCTFDHTRVCLRTCTYAYRFTLALRRDTIRIMAQ